MNSKLILSLACGVIAASSVKAQPRTHGYFECAVFSRKLVAAWMDGGPENLFTRTPFTLAQDGRYCTKVEDARKVALGGGFFSLTDAIREISTQATQGNFGAIFGWTEVLYSSPQGLAFARVLIEQLSTKNSAEYNFAICYAVDTLTDDLFSDRSVSTLAEFARLQKLIEKHKVPVDGRKFAHGDYCTFLSKRCMELQAPNQGRL